MEEKETQIPVQEAPQPQEQTPVPLPPSPTPVIAFLPYGMTEETYREKKAIRKTAATIGISLLITEIVFSFWAVAAFFAAKKIGIPMQTVYDVFIDPFVQQILQIVLSTIAFLIPALILFKIREQSISETVALSLPKKGTVIPMFLFGMAFCMFANIAVSNFGEFFSGFGIEYHTDKSEIPEGALGFFLAFLATCVFPALIEEFVFRGLIMGSLRKYGDGIAVLASAALFGLIHGNFEQIPFTFLVGLVLGFLVIETGSLWVGVAVHAGNNFVSFFLTYGFEDLPTQTVNMIYAMILMALLAAGLAALLLTGKKEGGFSFEKPATKATETQKAKWLVTSPFLLIFAAVCLFNALSALLEG